MSPFPMIPPSPGVPVPAASVEPEVPRRNRFRTALLVWLCCFVVYNANLRSISAGDTYPARYLPFAILKYRTLFLDPVANLAARGLGDGAFWIVHRPDGRMFSLYPVVLPVLVTPFYIPAVAYLNLGGWTDVRLERVARLMEKFIASSLAALSASLLYALMRRRASAHVALLLTAAYAFGTTTWVISSQALWQHGLAQVLVIAALSILTRPCTAPRAIAVGLLLGLIAGNRPPDAVLAAALGVCALFWAGRRKAPLLCAAAALPVLAVMLYNLNIAGNISGGYGLKGRATFFEHDLFTGLGGLLISPTRGLLVYSPFLIFLGLAWQHVPRDRAERRLALAIVAGVAVQIVLYAKADWRSGLSWGPRYLTDLIPLLMWMLVPVVAALRGVRRLAFVASVVLAIVIQAIGAFAYAPWQDVPIFAADAAPHNDMNAAFDWHNAGFLSLRHGRAPADLTVAIHGSFDGVASGGHPVETVAAGQDVVVSGWALAGKATPFQVAVEIDGGQAIGFTAFFDRPDVRAMMKTTSPAGWSIPVATDKLAPGKHRLTVFVWAYKDGEGHYLDERTLIVRNVSPLSRDLRQEAETAAGRIRDHQQAQGYWLTAYTNEARFHDPHPEMNTFLTSLLIDVLSPVAKTSGLEESLQRARAHLRKQIEPNGLVRYHGLPDAPGIGTLGCAITPDTDDTALVWRIAPGGDRARLNAALATIEQYRTGEGLYRTWLARREDYQCLDPGRDPNPADLTIQMHLLLLLSEVRPAESRALCDAVRPLVDDDRLWTYYAKTPLVPLLRTAELRRAGCSLQLPELRLRTDVPGQQVWVSVARMLAQDARFESAQSGRSVARSVLDNLARNDFELIRTTPPLLYHNDLTATVARYYWSEDAGYALWLRLYSLYERLVLSSPAG